jgi:heptosyltransferase-2
VKRILIRGVNWLGDTILTLPTVEGIRNLFPDSQISILANEDVCDLWRRFPFVNEVISFKREKGLKFILEDFRIRNLLREKNFDLAIILPKSFHSAIQIFLTQIPIRIGYEYRGRSLFLNYKIPRTKEVLNIHRILYYKKLIEIFGNNIENACPKIFLYEEDRRVAERVLFNSGVSNGRLLIGINPGATYGLAKCWIPQRFGELGKRISKIWGAKIIIFGRNEEKSIAQEIINIMGNNCIDLTGKTSILHLAAILEKCQLLISNDTGTMHLAAALGIPVIAIFGSTNPKITGPWGSGHIVIKKNVPCSPCFKRVCPVDHKCMELISVDEVEEAVNKKLQEIYKN